MAARKKYDLVVIGAGPGGYVASVRAAQSGLKVACIERHRNLGGVCLNVGCIPSKALLDSSEYFYLAKQKLMEHGVRTGDVAYDLAVMLARKEQVVTDLTENVRRLLQGNRIEIIHGFASLPTENIVSVKAGGRHSEDAVITELEASAIVLATGSEPVSVPGVVVDGERIVCSTEALSFRSVPNHLAVIGAGYIGLELGSVWSRLGAKVTVLEMMPKIATTLDGQISRLLQRILQKQGLHFQLQAKVLKAEARAADVLLELQSDGLTNTMVCDRLLVAVGRRPRTQGLNLEQIGVATHAKTGQVIIDKQYRTTVKHIYAIGDLVSGPMLAHKASAEGVAAVECLLGMHGEVNTNAIPSVIYTAPEVAAVGLSEEEAGRLGMEYCVGSYPVAGTGRARCMGETEGLVKIIAERKTDRVLGVHIIGARASDMIAEAVLAIEFGACSEDIARSMHAHPTFAEAMHEAALAVQKCSVYAS